MPILDEYISPQAQQAVIAGIFLAAGWWVVALQNRRRDAKLRAERINDMQRALLAEIRAHVVVLENQSFEADPQLLEQIKTDDYLPILPHDANDRIFRAIVEDVHMLPEWAIDPVVRYYRLVAVRTALAQDIRSNAENAPRRAAEMFRDYLVLTEETYLTGLRAVKVLTISLAEGRAGIQALYDDQAAEVRRSLSASLPNELAELRDGFNKRFSDRSDL